MTMGLPQTAMSTDIMQALPRGEAGWRGGRGSQAGDARAGPGGHARDCAGNRMPRPTRLSPWAQVPSWNIHRNMLDSLHLIWLGLGKDLAGSLAVLLAATHGGSAPCVAATHGGSAPWKLEQAFSELWQEYDAWCKRTGA